MKIRLATLLYLVALAAALLPSLAIAQSNVDERAICRAAIAAVMGRSPAIVKVTKVDRGVVSTSYTRPADGSVWRNRCQIKGDRVIWATDTGRWRDGPHDERIQYDVRGNAIAIVQRFTDGSKSEEVFPLSALK